MAGPIRRFRFYSARHPPFTERRLSSRRRSSVGALQGSQRGMCWCFQHHPFWVPRPGPDPGDKSFAPSASSRENGFPIPAPSVGHWILDIGYWILRSKPRRPRRGRPTFEPQLHRPAHPFFAPSASFARGNLRRAASELNLRRGCNPGLQPNRTARTARRAVPTFRRRWTLDIELPLALQDAFGRTAG